MVAAEDQIKLNASDKGELEKMLNGDKGSLQVLRNTLVVYNIFVHEIEEVKAEEEKKEESEEHTTKMATISAISQELTDFYGDRRMLEHTDLVNEVLAILRRANLNELNKDLTDNIVCIFEAHLPDLDRMFKRLKEKQEAGAEEQKNEIRMRPIAQKDEEAANKNSKLFKNVDWDLS